MIDNKGLDRRDCEPPAPFTAILVQKHPKAQTVDDINKRKENL
jgi:hypothetical protein